MRNASSAQLARKIYNQSAPIVVVEPVFEVMQARKVIASAFTAAIAVELDVMEQMLGRPVLLRLIQHPGEGERDFKKGPAIHSLKIHRRRFNSIVDFEGEMLVTRSDQRLSRRRRPFADRKCFPILALRSRDQPIELILSLEDGLERQLRFDRSCD